MIPHRGEPRTYRLTIPCWKDGVWGVKEYFFDTLREAKEFARRSTGRYKIYNAFGILRYDSLQNCDDDPYY